MSRRYDPHLKTLDLSQFHLDEGINWLRSFYYQSSKQSWINAGLRTDYYTPLSRENVMQTVVKIIGEHIPDVQAIDASNNKLHSVEQMKLLITKAVSLKSLNLGNNKLIVGSLDSLQGLQLEELILNQNPLCDRFNEQSSYIRYISW